MADAVALTSVITSGAVAMGGIVVGALGARSQRRHEKELAFEERVWETKSDAMFRLITVVQDFRRTLRADKPRERLAARLPDTIDDLHAIAPVIEAYCSETCRVAFIALHMLLSDAPHDWYTAMQIKSVREDKEQAIEEGDFEAAAELHRKERDLLAVADEGLDLDLDKAQRLADAALTAARQNLQGR